MSADKDQVRAAVRDSGNGIDPVAIAHIFEPFFTTKPKGMGMGLAIVRSIIKARRMEVRFLCGGTLIAAPRSKSPCRCCKRKSMMSASSNQTTMNDKEVVTAIIDDDESIRKALVRMLGAAGMGGLGLFSSAKEFLAVKSKTTAYRVWFQICEMPGIDGLHLQSSFGRTHAPCCYCVLLPDTAMCLPPYRL